MSTKSMHTPWRFECFGGPGLRGDEEWRLYVAGIQDVFTPRSITEFNRRLPFDALDAKLVLAVHDLFMSRVRATLMVLPWVPFSWDADADEWVWVRVCGDEESAKGGA